MFGLFLGALTFGGQGAGLLVERGLDPFGGCGLGDIHPVLGVDADGFDFFPSGRLRDGGGLGQVAGLGDLGFGVGPDAFGLGEGVLGGFVGLGAFLDGVFPGPAGFAGVAFGVGLGGLDLGDPLLGGPMGLLDLVGGGVGVGDRPGELAGLLHEGGHLRAVPGGDLLKLGQQGFEGEPPVGHRPLGHRLPHRARTTSLGAAGVFVGPAGGERLRPRVPRIVAIGRGPARFTRARHRPLAQLLRAEWELGTVLVGCGYCCRFSLILAGLTWADLRFASWGWCRHRSSFLM